MLERIFQEPKFRVCCLGAIKLVEAGSGTDMTPASRKTRALLGYLCVVGKPVGRERLASLLWGDRGDEQARASLRQAIYELRSLLGGDHLVKVERDTVAAGDDVGTDIAEITAAAESGDLQQLTRALAAWRGDFFEDLASIDPGFDAWLQAERLRVQESLIGAATEAAKAGTARGEIDAARKIVNLLQQHDGANEVVLRMGLRLDHLAGDSGGLHRRYERFRELLKAELNAAPAAETKLLFDELTTQPSPPELFDATDAGGDAAIAPLQPMGTQSPVGADTETRVLPPTHLRQSWKLAGLLVAIVALGALGWFVWRAPHNAAPPRAEPLLAVMPFQNLSADAGARASANGISQEIVNALQQTTKIRVAPALSGFPNAGAPAATHVLSGSVERAGDRIHVIAQLMDITDDRVVWGHAYDRAMAQTPAPGHDIAGQIARALGKLLSSDSFGATRMGSAAYDYYLKGRNLLRENDPRAAAAELETSVRIAPNFANAWAILAAVRLSLATNMFAEHMDSGVPMAIAARAAAERALALDPNNSEAQGVLAMLVPATRLVEIDRQFQPALRSEPNNAQVLDWHAEFLMYVGRNHEALNELKRAYILNREIPSVATDLVLASLKAGRMDEARDIMGLVGGGRDKRLRAAFYLLRVKYFLYKRDWFGLATYLSALPDRLSPPDAAFLHLCRDTAIAFATRETDRFGRLRASWRGESSVDVDDATEFLSALGDDSAALKVVQSAVSASRNGAFLTDPQWEALFAPDLVPLRSDPRVPALLAQWGLTDYWRATNHPPDYMR